MIMFLELVQTVASESLTSFCFDVYIDILRDCAVTNVSKFYVNVFLSIRRNFQSTLNFLGVKFICI